MSQTWTVKLEQDFKEDAFLHLCEESRAMRFVRLRFKWTKDKGTKLEVFASPSISADLKRVMDRARREEVITLWDAQICGLLYNCAALHYRGHVATLDVSGCISLWNGGEKRQYSSLTRFLQGQCNHVFSASELRQVLFYRAGKYWTWREVTNEVRRFKSMKLSARIVHQSGILLRLGFAESSAESYIQQVQDPSPLALWDWARAEIMDDQALNERLSSWFETWKASENETEAALRQRHVLSLFQYISPMVHQIIRHRSASGREGTFTLAEASEMGFSREIWVEWDADGSAVEDKESASFILYHGTTLSGAQSIAGGLRLSRVPHQCFTGDDGGFYLCKSIETAQYWALERKKQAYEQNYAAICAFTFDITVLEESPLILTDIFKWRAVVQDPIKFSQGVIQGYECKNLRAVREGRELPYPEEGIQVCFRTLESLKALKLERVILFK